MCQERVREPAHARCADGRPLGQTRLAQSPAGPLGGGLPSAPLWQCPRFLACMHCPGDVQAPFHPPNRPGAPSSWCETKVSRIALVAPLSQVRHDERQTSNGQISLGLYNEKARLAVLETTFQRASFRPRVAARRRRVIAKGAPPRRGAPLAMTRRGLSKGQPLSEVVQRHHAPPSGNHLHPCPCRDGGSAQIACHTR